MFEQNPGVNSTELLARAFSVLQSEEEYCQFLKDLFTTGELENLAQRLIVANMLDGSDTYTRIAENTGASTATISRVKRFLTGGFGGYQLVLERLREKGVL
ncbi:MAG: YerC/YecD family TrpR-related protein [Bacillota bacterium]